jgi:hypothetical protein
MYDPCDRAPRHFYYVPGERRPILTVRRYNGAHPPLTHRAFGRLRVCPTTFEDVYEAIPRDELAPPPAWPPNANERWERAIERAQEAAA